MMQRDAVLHEAVRELLATEESLDRALLDQIDEYEATHPDTVLHLRYVESFVRSHIVQLRDLAAGDDTFGDRLGEQFRRARLALASAADFVRNDTLPDQLRRDYSVASLAYAGYRALFTTASALNAGATCRLSAEFLADYSRITLILQDLLPDAVVTQLEADGLRPEASALRSRDANRIDGVPVHVG